MTVVYFGVLFGENYDGEGWGYINNALDFIALNFSVDVMEFKKIVNGKYENCYWNEVINEKFKYYWSY